MLINERRTELYIVDAPVIREKHSGVMMMTFLSPVVFSLVKRFMQTCRFISAELKTNCISKLFYLIPRRIEIVI